MLNSCFSRENIKATHTLASADAHTQRHFMLQRWRIIFFTKCISNAHPCGDFAHANFNLPASCAFCARLNVYKLTKLQRQKDIIFLCFAFRKCKNILLWFLRRVIILFSKNAEVRWKLFQEVGEEIMPLTNTDFDTTLKSCSQSQLRKLNKRFVCGKRSRKDLRIEPILNKQGHGKLRS